MNPFIFKDYKDPTYFCDRENETSKMISAIENGRDMMLFSLRRMGKTGLLKHVEHHYKDDKDVVFIYFDIYFSTNLLEFVNLFGTAVITKLEKTKSRIYKRVSSFVKSVMPSIHINPVTFETEINFNVQNKEDAQITIAQIFNLIKASKKKVVLGIDEFQQIANYPEKNVEAILRTYVQSIGNLQVVFSGSSQHLLTNMFTSQSRPFYQSVQPMELGPIDEQKYVDFIHSHFTNNGRKIEKTDIKHILHILRHHTYYVQYLCNTIYSCAKRNLTPAVINDSIREAISDHEGYFLRFRDLLTDNQFTVLKAIAKEDKFAKPTSNNFLKKHRLPATSTVNSAIISLIQKEFLYKYNGYYYVSDVFFSLWLKSIY